MHDINKNLGHLTEEEKTAFYEYVTTVFPDLTPHKIKELVTILHNIKRVKLDQPTKLLQGSPRFVFNEFDPVKQTIKIFTDGSGEDGNRIGIKGAWAYIMYDDEQEQEFYKNSMSVSNTTVNRMELTATIEAIKTLLDKDVNIDIYTDSMYVWYSFNPEKLEKVIKTLDATYTYTDEEVLNCKDIIPNIDLVTKLYFLCKQSRVRVTWVKGHVGINGNESVDTLASSTCQRLPALKTDITDRVLQHKKSYEIIQRNSQR